MKWLTARKFNQIDLVTACAGGIFFGHEEYLSWLIIVLVGVAISVVAEHSVTAKAKVTDRPPTEGGESDAIGEHDGH